MIMPAMRELRLKASGSVGTTFACEPWPIHTELQVGSKATPSGRSESRGHLPVGSANQGIRFFARCLAHMPNRGCCSLVVYLARHIPNRGDNRQIGSSLT